MAVQVAHRWEQQTVSLACAHWAGTGLDAEDATALDLHQHIPRQARGQQSRSRKDLYHLSTLPEAQSLLPPRSLCLYILAEITTRQLNQHDLSRRQSPGHRMDELPRLDRRPGPTPDC